MAIAAKRARVALVVGVEQMTTTPGPEIGKNLLKASYVRDEAEIDGGFAGIFGKIAALYFRNTAISRTRSRASRPRTTRTVSAIPTRRCARTSATTSAAVSDKNPFVAGPLKRTDCSLVSDGAAALVLADEETAFAMGKAVAFRAAAHVQDFLPMAKRDILKFEGCALAWQRALAEAGLTLGDLSFVETHDCFTIAELIEYEAMGLVPEGRGASAIRDGLTAAGGRLPVNPSGGLKSKGHPIGATGVSMHALAAMQLTGTAGDMGEQRAPRRHLQHGRGRGRELCEHTGARPVAGISSSVPSSKRFSSISSRWRSASP